MSSSPAYEVRGLTEPLTGAMYLHLQFPCLVFRETAAPQSHEYARFPIAYLRGYGQAQRHFAFEAGRRCELGPKKFTFKLLDDVNVSSAVDRAIREGSAANYIPMKTQQQQQKAPVVSLGSERSVRGRESTTDSRHRRSRAVSNVSVETHANTPAHTHVQPPQQPRTQTHLQARTQTHAQTHTQTRTQGRAPAHPPQSQQSQPQQRPRSQAHVQRKRSSGGQTQPDKATLAYTQIQFDDDSDGSDGGNEFSITAKSQPATQTHAEDQGNATSSAYADIDFKKTEAMAQASYSMFRPAQIRTPSTSSRHTHSSHVEDRPEELSGRGGVADAVEDDISALMDEFGLNDDDDNDAGHGRATGPAYVNFSPKHMK
ncbi:hypothetical protein PTSG_10713 [Salpingoeca rosetta]|uniref:IRS-type PTB domain-containing protein n=1 Tax=Salpingoeca rosetta (strain ATCC 50818 / BSB-021) TaxID=946362 RepID=F2UQ61_SALR5|nr:uncharacterized protein PTSG_10713 [Salpingoeca rosetta]EGD79729.1 hypothetical protein PTSG_10713 [Salpingoeca rosetta]|eukprot:XP_004988678.1 hypothetical protein PTSG_10713 [Salpingoeca rosetta]